jgi:CHASE2 domain-containing sensor protein
VSGNREKMLRLFCAAVAALSSVFLLRSCAFLQLIESDFYTVNFPTAPASVSFSDFTVIDIDQNALDQWGGKINREAIATVAQAAIDHGAYVVAIDVVFHASHSPSIDAALVELTKNGQKVIFGIDDELSRSLFSELVKASPKFGHVRAIRDSKERVTSVHHVAYAPSMAEVIYKEYCAIKKLRCIASAPISNQEPTYSAAEPSWGINYGSGFNSIRRFNMDRMTDPKILKQLNEKIVFISPSARSLGDMKRVPIDWKMTAQDYPGSFTIAAAVHTLLNDQAIWTFSVLQLVGLIFFLNLVIFSFLTKYRNKSLLVIGACIFIVFSARYIGFHSLRIYIPATVLILNFFFLWILNFFSPKTLDESDRGASFSL